MPTYDYVCDKCGHEFDTFQSIKDDPLKTCPACSRKALRRVITGGTGVIFRGEGFYVTDSKGTKGGAGARSKAETDKPTEAAPTAETATKSDSKSNGTKSDSKGGEQKSA